MMSDDPAGQAAIEQRLAQTRARMGSRLSELRGRLSPGQVLDDLMGYARSSEGGDFSRNLVASVRANPLPAALTGISFAWLMAANARRASSTSTEGKGAPTLGYSGAQHVEESADDLEARFRRAEQQTERRSYETADDYNIRLSDVQGSIVGIKRQSQDSIQSFSQRIQDALAAAKDKAAKTADGLRDRTQNAAGQLVAGAQNVGGQIAQGSKSARDMGGSVLSTIADNPVLLGAIGAAVGAILGALIPQSDQEEAALSGMAKQARDTVRTLAQEAIDRGGQVAHDVLDAGRESAREHGLTPEKSIGDVVDQFKSGALAETVTQVAHDVLKSGEDSVRKEGLKADSSGTKGSAQPA